MKETHSLCKSSSETKSTSSQGLWVDTPEFLTPVKSLGNFTPNPLSPEFVPLHFSLEEKKVRKKKSLRVNSLSEGFQLLGNGRETVLVSMKRIQITQKSSPFSLDLSQKPKSVPSKYWNQRHTIFSKYDEGVQMDLESWFSVTHEPIAKIIAEQCQHFETIMDGFAGAGGNVIQFAHHKPTLAVDCDLDKLNMLWHNAQIYGVNRNITLIHGDFLEKALQERPDVIFMSPPWGGPNYKNMKKFDLFKHITPDISNIMKVCNQVTKNIILYLPRTANPAQVVQLFQFLPNIQRKIEFQLYSYGTKVKTIACFIGDIVEVDHKAAAFALFNRMKIPKPFPIDLEKACAMFEDLAQRFGTNHALEILYSHKKRKKNKKKKPKSNESNSD